MNSYSDLESLFLQAADLVILDYHCGCGGCEMRIFSKPCAFGSRNA
jgi:hypothetical protein